jgi:hypothetical protein
MTFQTTLAACLIMLAAIPGPAWAQGPYLSPDEQARRAVQAAIAAPIPYPPSGYRLNQGPAAAYPAAPGVGVQESVQPGMYGTLPPGAPPGSITAEEMYARVAMMRARGLPGAGAPPCPGNPNCPCVAMGGCACQTCMCDAVRAGMTRGAGPACCPPAQSPAYAGGVPTGGAVINVMGGPYNGRPVVGYGAPRVTESLAPYPAQGGGYPAYQGYPACTAPTSFPTYAAPRAAPPSYGPPMMCGPNGCVPVSMAPAMMPMMSGGGYRGGAPMMGSC